MKNSLIICLIIAIMLIFTPLIGLKNDVQSASRQQTEENSVQQTTEKTEETGETIAVFRHLSGAVEQLSLTEYAIGAVAGEMPAVYPEQALMAQAAASLNIVRLEVLEGAKSELNGAVISDDSASHQCCMAKEEMREKWGDNYNVYYNKIEQAVNEVIGSKIVYGDKLASTVFHAVSSGKTESAENVWSGEVAYLQSVESSFDREKPDFISTLILSDEVFADMLKSKLNIEVEGAANTWIGESKYSEAGTLLSVDICSSTVKGALLRSALSLKSAAIKIEYGESGFVFTVSGYGHGVGMSQYGASKMAENGSSWQEIIAHYYPGTEIVPA